MIIALECELCGKKMRVDERFVGKRATCPQCKAPFIVAHQVGDVTEAVVVADDEPAVEVWKPDHVVKLETRRRRPWLWIALLLIPILGVGTLISLPYWLPRHPLEVVIRDYLAAVRNKDQQLIDRLGVIEDPPLTRSIGQFEQRPDLGQDWKGSLKEVVELHEHLGRTYRPQGDVYIKTDLTSTLAKVINMGQDFQQRAKTEFSIEPRPGQDPNDRLMDVAENMANAYLDVTKLVTGGLKADAIVVTYDQAVAEWGGKLDATQQELAQSFAKDRKKWVKLLGRDPQTLKEAKDFEWKKAYVDAAVWLPGQSSGEPPRHVRLTLVRFSTDGLIDSGWKVWSIDQVAEQDVRASRANDD